MKVTRLILDFWPIHRLRRLVARGLQSFLKGVFRPFLRTVLRWRYAATALGFSFLSHAGFGVQPANTLFSRP